MKTVVEAALLTVMLAGQSAGSGVPVVYRVGNAEYEGYYADAGKGAPFILLIHDWDGLTAYEKKRSDMLQSLGYTVFAADLFGKGIRPESLDEKKRLTGQLYGDRVKMRMLLDGALEAARTKGAAVTDGAAIGYCFGGAAVLEYARSGAALKGFVVFHAGLATPEGEDYTKVKGKVLVLHGSADRAVPLDQFNDCATAMNAAHVNFEMVLYGGADHAFTVFGGERYDKNADKLSWARATSFLAALLRK